MNFLDTMQHLHESNLAFIEQNNQTCFHFRNYSALSVQGDLHTKSMSSICGQRQYNEHYTSLVRRKIVDIGLAFQNQLEHASTTMRVHFLHLLESKGATMKKFSVFWYLWFLVLSSTILHCSRISMSINGFSFTCASIITIFFSMHLFWFVLERCP